MFQGEHITPSNITLSLMTLSLASDEYCCSFDLYGQIEPEQSDFSYDGRYLMLRVQKKNFSNSYWPSLTKETLPYIVRDFNRVRVSPKLSFPLYFRCLIIGHSLSTLKIKIWKVFSGLIWIHTPGIEDSNRHLATDNHTAYLRPNSKWRCLWAGRSESGRWELVARGCCGSAPREIWKTMEGREILEKRSRQLIWA